MLFFRRSKSLFNELVHEEQRDSLKNAQLVVECIQSAVFSRKNFRASFDETFTPHPYQSNVARGKRSFQQVFVPQRYFLPYKLFRQFFIPNLLRTVKWIINAVPLFSSPTYDNGKTIEDVECVVEGITKRAREITALGHQYLFIPIPIKKLVDFEKVTPSTLWLESELVKRLKANGVHAIDLLPLFREHRKEGLYFKTDSHWNIRGVRLALAEVVQYIKDNSLVNSKDEACQVCQ